jgi:hypothetical protein
MTEPDSTVATVRYFGSDFPMQFAMCLRMRQENIESVILGNKEIAFETFEDRCSTFVYVPLTMERAGTLEVTINHPIS